LIVKIHVIQDVARVSKADEIVEQVFPAAFPWDGIRRMTPSLFAMFAWSLIVAGKSPSAFFLGAAFFTLFDVIVFASEYRSEKYRMDQYTLRFGGFFDREIFEIKQITCKKIMIESVRYANYKSWFIYYGAAKVNGKNVYIHSTRIRGEVVQIEYKGRFLIISPKDPDGFLQAIEAVQQAPTQPRAL
jgi:Bacterial PH domain